MGKYTRKDMNKVAKPTYSGRDMRERGTYGLKQSNGTLFEEFLPQLRGEQGRRIYREMMDNDATIGSVLFIIEMMFRAMIWRVESRDDKMKDESKYSAEQKEAIEWLRGVLFKDMDIPFSDFLSEALSFLGYGWAYFEIVYKLRIGPEEKDPKRKSYFTDGKIGIRKLAIRSQDTLDHWEIDEDNGGEIRGMWQNPPFSYGTLYIPIEKALLFRTKPYRGSPEGRSVLRNVYRAWYHLKYIEEYESIAIERELNGLPVVKIPQELLASDDPTDIAVVNSYLELARDIKRNEQGGIVIPSNPYRDRDGKISEHKLVDVSLLASEGTRDIDTDKVITRYQFNIARALLLDFMMIGSGDRGSFALSKSKIDIFLRAIRGWLECIARPINDHLIPKLWKMNNFNPKVMPRIAPGSLSPENLEEIGTFLEKLKKAGMIIFPDTELENDLRRIAGLPEKSIDPEDKNIRDKIRELEINPKEIAASNEKKLANAKKPGSKPSATKKTQNL